MKAGEPAPRPLAQLAMYDWPAVRGATDRLWQSIREALTVRGVAASNALDRSLAMADTWRDPGLVLGQTCGLPYVRHLRGRVALLGAPDYGLEGCPPGYYRSALVVRADEPGEALAAFAGARLATNETGSQSGYAALARAWDAAGLDRLALGRALVTGAHAASIAAVAEGRADLAAIDAVAWRLAQRHLPSASRLRVLAWTPPTPGLPMIAAKGQDAGNIAGAVADGIAALDGVSRAALGIEGFQRFAERDYEVIADGSRLLDGVTVRA